MAAYCAISGILLEDTHIWFNTESLYQWCADQICDRFS